MPAIGLTDLVAHAYEAACDTAGMSGFVENAAEYFGAQQSAFTIRPNGNCEALLPITHGISTDEIAALYGERGQSGTMFAALDRTPPGRTIAIDGYNRPGATRKVPARRSTDVALNSVNILAGVVIADDNNRCDLVLFRDKAKGDYSPSEHEALRELMGYLRRAIELNKRFVKIFVEHRSAISVLEDAPRSIMIIGQAGEVTYRNLAARKLLARNDGLSLQDGRFTVADATARDRVEEFLQAARAAEQPASEAERLMIVVPRESDGSPYKLVMYRLPFDRQQAALDQSQSLAVALVYDPSTLNQLNENLLRTFYNLTHAETALAQALFDGRALPEASADLGISVNTSRTQLRSIFRKVGVHSQAALMQELAKSFIHA
ncbi:MAG: helix-turn-helix transcriptional regulator [Gammaproteobacteria bacterium]